MQNWIPFQTVTNSDGELVSERQRKLKRGKVNLSRWIQLSWNENFSYEKFVLRVEQEMEGTQNWILSQTVTNSEREFVSQLHKKVKIREIELMLTNSALRKSKFFLKKIGRESRRRKGGDAELNSLSNCHKLRSRIGVSTAEENEKYGKYHSCWRIQLSQN